MKKVNVAIIGATGSVGREMLNILNERNFPINELKLLASEKSKGNIINFKKKDYVVQKTTQNSFKEIDIVLNAVDNKIAKKYIPYAVKEGCVVIDNSSAYRLNTDVPLVIPELNREDIKKHKGIISNPNCSTIIALTAINELNKFSKINRMIVSTYQAVSGAGNKGILELENQVKDIVNDRNVSIDKFKYQIAFNLIPHIGDFMDNGYTKEEMKMQNEGRKILHNESLKVNCTCIRVPIYRSHSISITIETDKKITTNKAFELIKNTEGAKLVDDKDLCSYPMPLESSNQDLVYVGRIREDISKDNSLTLWCCGDQIRKGAATNAVQIAEELIKLNYLLK